MDLKGRDWTSYGKVRFSDPGHGLRSFLRVLDVVDLRKTSCAQHKPLEVLSKEV